MGADERLAERQFEFDKQLARERFAYDRRQAVFKRRSNWPSKSWRMPTAFRD